jgi:hypothetical protein
MDGNRIGDDGDQLKRVTKIAGKEGDEVGIDRKGERDDFWTMSFDQFAKSEVGGAVREEGVFDEREVVAREIKEVPSMRISVDQGEVEAPKKIVEHGTRFGERVGHYSSPTTELDGAGKAACGGVVSVAKSGGENEDGRRVHIKPSRSNSSRRRSSDWSTISVTPPSSRRMSRLRAIFSLGRPVVSMTRRFRVR